MTHRAELNVEAGKLQYVRQQVLAADVREVKIAVVLLILLHVLTIR